MAASLPRRASSGELLNAAAGSAVQSRDPEGDTEIHLPNAVNPQPETLLLQLCTLITYH
jgi:hypothetical protein